MTTQNKAASISFSRWHKQKVDQFSTRA